MITNHQTDYQTAKNNVLSMYESTMALTKHELVKDFIKPHQNVLDSLRNEIERVRADKFSLMVAGEAKSGKSTFINAYLGIDILPMDVKQCTSSIIEIKYGEELLLEVEYAGGKKEKIKGEETIRQFLKDNAAIDDEYRAIPVPVINTELLIKSKGNPSKADITILIDAVQEANIEKLEKEEYANRIRQYVKTKCATWKSIVTKITIYYPFASEELKGIEIIDSPGVNAAGKIGDVTEQYIKNADAIMFLKPLVGAALESSDFKNFLEKSSNEKSSNALFLILTRAANSSKIDIQTICEQATTVYKGISKEQILPVDSKARMYKSQFSELPAEDLKNWIKNGMENETIDSFLDRPWMLSDGNKHVFIEKLEQLSGFTELDDAMNKFGRKAHYNRLESIKNKLDNILKKIFTHLTYNSKLQQEKIEDPSTFTRKIEQLIKELQKTEANMFEGINEIKEDFIGQTGTLNTETEKLKSLYEEKFKNFSTNDYDELKNLSDQAVEDYLNLFTFLSQKLIAECNNKLIHITDKINIPSELLTVTITEEELNEMKKHAEEEANVTENVTTGRTFKKTTTKSVFSKDQYTKVIRESILSRLDDIINDCTKILKQFTDGLLEQYQDKLVEQAEQLEEQLQKIEKDASTNAEMILKAQEYTTLINEVQNIQEVKENALRKGELNVSR